MTTVKLKDSIKSKKTIIVEKKPALYAMKCDSCGLVFEMDKYCNDNDLARLKGTFDICCDGRGNQFESTVCSFKCADNIMKNGWKSIKEYKNYAKSKANLVRCELKITSYLVNEEELIKRWNNKNNSDNNFVI